MPEPGRRSRLFLLSTAFGMLLTAAGPAEPRHGRLAYSSPLAWPLLLTQTQRSEPGKTDSADVPDGARIVLFDPSTAQSAKSLTLDFFAAAWPDVSFDASRFLFVARRASSDPPAVWEFSLTDGATRRITDAVPCRRAIYLSPFYSLELDGPEDRIALLARPPGESLDAIFTGRRDGSDIRRITFSPRGIDDLLQLTDGRLLFSMPSTDTQHLFTVHMDGADLFPFAGIYDPPARQTMPCETADANVLFLESPITGGVCGKGLSVNPSGACIARTTTLATVSAVRSLRTRRSLMSLSVGVFRSLSPLPDGRVLVSYRPSDDMTFGVYLLDPHNGGPPTQVFDDPDCDELGAVTLAPRAEPAGRSSGIEQKTRTGQLYCLNAYLSDPADGRPVPSGAIDRVRIVRDPSNATSASSASQVLMEAKVEPDGSFFAEVPAETPLRVETLDETGRVLRAMRTPMWVMPGEERGCIGCHEDRELTPPNRHVLALRKPPQRAAPIPSRPQEHASQEKDTP